MYNSYRFYIIVVIVSAALSLAGMVVWGHDPRWFIVIILSLISVVFITATKDPVKILLLYIAMKFTIADYFLHSRSYGGIMVGIDHALLLAILFLKWPAIRKGAVSLFHGRRNTRYLLLFIIFLALAFLACINGSLNGFPEGNIRSFQELYVEGFLVFVISSCLLYNAAPKTFERLLFGLIIIVGITAVYQLYVFLTGNPFLFREASTLAVSPTEARTGGFFVNPNNQATLYSMVLPTIVLSFYFWDGLYKKLLMAVVASLIAASYVTLGARGPLLFLVFTMIISLIVAFLKHRHKLSAVLPRTSLIFIACLVIFFIVSILFRDEIDFYWARLVLTDLVYEERWGLYNATADAIIMNPFIGIGLDAGNFIATVLFYGGMGVPLANAHNVYLSLALSVGLLGGIMFALIVIVSLWRLYKICHRSIEAILVLSAILAFALVCLAEPIYMNGSKLNNLFYLFLGAGFALFKKYRNQGSID